MRRGRNRDVNIFSVSFLDVLANTIGGLAFLLMLAVLLASEAAAPPPPSPPPDLPRPLQIATRALPDARVGGAYSVDIATSGGLSPIVVSGRGASHDNGVDVRPREGAIGGTPSRAGVFSYSLLATDRTGTTASATLPLIIRPAVQPLEIQSQGVVNARAGVPFHLALAATGGYAPYRWRLAGGALPAGLALRGDSGEVSGTPERPGETTVTFAATDADGKTVIEPAANRFDIFTKEGFRQLTIATQAIPTLIVGHGADVTLSAEGGLPPYRWTAQPALPATLRIERNRIMGTPSYGVRTVVDFTVADASGQRATARYDLVTRRLLPYWLGVVLGSVAALAIVVSAWMAYRRARSVPPALRLSTASVPNARASTEYSVQLAAEGGVPPYAWRVVEGELPAGMHLSPGGELSGTPYLGIAVDATREITFVVEVTDRRGETDRRTL